MDSVRARAGVRAGLADWAARRRRSPRQARDAMCRAWRYSGAERQRLLLVAKSAVAAVLAWSVAAYGLVSPQPTYAPFTALLVVQATVYRSLVQTVRYVAAVVLGVLAAGAVGPLLGENAGAFAVMLVATLVVGQWRRLGSQGVQVSVAGVFAYSALSGAHVSMLGEIVAMALLGAGVGLAVSLLVVPPLRYRTASEGIESVSGSLRRLLQDMAAGLRGGAPDSDAADDWLARARRLDGTVGAARQAVETGAESTRYNPRRLLGRRDPPPSFSGYRVFLDSLARGAEQVRSIAYGLRRLSDADGPDGTPRPDGRSLHAYGDLLDVLADAAARIGALEDGPEEGAGDGGGAAPADDPLRRALRDARERQRELVASVGDTPAWRSHGVLLTDMERLTEEFEYAHARGATQPPPA
ncbi:aromatic acid exporter family protein [Streptomyces phytohabitans]|uniref:FUSC family protein n=1 Tax=Streptomyces phytohabitans TaxID=1150371 RepID=UPI00345B90F8